MERREDAAAAGLGREPPWLRRRSRRATVWGLSWAKTAARVSSEAAAASMSVYWTATARGRRRGQEQSCGIAFARGAWLLALLLVPLAGLRLREKGFKRRAAVGFSGSAKRPRKQRKEPRAELLAQYWLESFVRLLRKA